MIAMALMCDPELLIADESVNPASTDEPVVTAPVAAIYPNNTAFRISLTYRQVVVPII
jgi:ABC-type antimicrobial peptide transport system ATPase subunit